MRSSRSSSKRWIVAVIAAFVVAFFALPKSAKACGGGSSYGGGGSSGMSGLVVGVEILAIGVAATDVGMGVYDIAKGVSGEHTSKSYAIFETSFAGAQAAGVWLGVSETRNINWSPALVAVVAVPSLLTLHGILTLTTVDWGAQKRLEMQQADPRSMPYGAVPYAPYAPPPPPPPPPPGGATNDTPAETPPPEDRLRIRFVPTMIPSTVQGNTTMAPGLAAFGTF